MMKNLLFAAVVALAFTFIGPAHAQQVRVVTTCGSVSPYHALNPGSVTSLYVDPNGNICGSGGGGGGGAITSPLGPTTAPSAAVAITDTGTNITGSTLGAGGQGLTGWLSQFSQQITNGSDSANNAKTATAVNVSGTDCSGSITTGGTAQTAISAQTGLHGFTIMNIDTGHNDEPLWISFTGTAAALTAASYPLAAPTATTFVGAGSYTTPVGFGTSHAVSIIGATTGHIFSCTWW